MKTKVLKPDVKFTVVNNSKGIFFRVIDNKNGKVLYKTECPATIAFLYADYWIYCTDVKEMQLSSLSDLAEDSEFLSMDIEESLAYLDSWEFLTVFAHMRNGNDLHSVIECSKKPRSIAPLALFSIDEIPQLIDDIYKSKTMGDIVNRMLEFIRVYPQV